MIPEIGQFALVLALVVALVQSVVPLVGAARGNANWMASAAPSSVMQFVLLLVAFGALIYSFAIGDFTVSNVAENSNSLQPFMYKIASSWGSHEGSMVMWVTILTLFGAMVAVFGGNLPPTLKARTLAVQSMISFAFLLFILLTSNPFNRLDPPPLDGRDLNPLLQDVGLAMHPPMLYVGYVGFSIVFSFAIAALIEGKVDAAWARWVRPWTLVSWAFLTFGIGLGSWWAYYELGWGGWWYWDPVENSSFMPWLVGTALLHSAIVVEKRDALKTWTILLAIITFSLSLVGTFLVRSGVLTSVHAFAVDPKRGTFMLALLIVAIGGSLLLYAWRAPTLKGGGLFAPISREGALILNNLLLTTATLTVFIGTMYPLMLDAMTGNKISVGPPFYNMTFVPVMIPLIMALGVGPVLAWKRGDLAGAMQRLKFAFVAAIVATVIAGYITWGRSIFGALGMGLAGWLAAGVCIEFGERIGIGRVSWDKVLRRAAGLPRSAWGMSIAHFGFAVVVAGATGASIWQTEAIRNAGLGDTIELSGYSITLNSVDQIRGPNYAAERGIFTVRKDGKVLTTLEPEQRHYFVQQRPTTESAIYSNGFADLYLVIGQPAPVLGQPTRFIGQGTPTGPWVVSVYYRPLVPFLWWGVLLMVFGGLVSLADRRLRVGAPSRKKRAAPAPAVVAPAE